MKVSIAETLQQMCSPQEVRQVRKKCPSCLLEHVRAPENRAGASESAGLTRPRSSRESSEKKCGTKLCCASADNL